MGGLREGGEHMETHREGWCCRKRSSPEEHTAIDHPSDGSSLLRYPELHLLKTNFPLDDVTRELSAGCVWAEYFQPERRKDCIFRKLLFAWQLQGTPGPPGLFCKGL